MHPRTTPTSVPASCSASHRQVPRSNQPIDTKKTIVKDQAFEQSQAKDVIGSRKDDRITGDAGPNRLDGDGGNDVLDGGLGPDLLKSLNLALPAAIAGGKESELPGWLSQVLVPTLFATPGLLLGVWLTAAA